ncbi:hypothetical protein K523DRAFT_326422 [Schizophyllum commune Tattone D]|nr:hypothetical protein K523DRAFT_326422 [Schizophyllum commune Tattone D]
MLDVDEHPLVVDEIQPKESRALECKICFNTFVRPNILTECGHSFCQACITGWFRSPNSGNKCPVCRTQTKGQATPNFSLIDYLAEKSEQS